jgi:hypothetical protein
MYGYEKREKKRIHLYFLNVSYCYSINILCIYKTTIKMVLLPYHQVSLIIDFWSANKRNLMPLFTDILSSNEEDLYAYKYIKLNLSIKIVARNSKQIIIYYTFFELYDARGYFDRKSINYIDEYLFLFVVNKTISMCFS